MTKRTFRTLRCLSRGVAFLLLMGLVGVGALQLPAVQRFLVFHPWVDALYRHITTDPSPYSTLRRSLVENFPGFAYAYITQEVVGRERDPERIVLQLAGYTHENLFNPPHYQPRDEAPIEVLRRGVGWCDQSAHLLIQVLDRRNIPAHGLFLRDERGVSPHSVAAVYLDGAWRIIDPWVLLIPRNKSGKLATFEEIRRGQVVYDGLPPDQIGLPHYAGLFANEPSVFRRNLAAHPSVFEFVRKGESPPHKTRADSWQRLFALFKPVGSDLFVGLYLQALRDQYDHEGEYAYAVARTYHILRKYPQARRWYARAAASAAQKRHREASAFFMGLASYQQGQYETAAKIMDRLIKNHPRSLWVHAARFVDGASRYRMGQLQMAKLHLRRAAHRSGGRVVWDAQRLLAIMQSEELSL